MKKILLAMSICILSACVTTEKEEDNKKEPNSVLHGGMFKHYEISHEGVKIANVSFQKKERCKESSLVGIKKAPNCIPEVIMEIKNLKSVPAECNIVTNSRVILMEKEVIFKYKRSLILKENEKMEDITITCI